MPRKKKTPELTFVEKMRRINAAGIKNFKAVNQQFDPDDTPLDDLPTRIQRVLGIFKNTSNDSKRMIYFIMYDIENNKIRNHIAKYLLQKGCVRVQKSIFLADTERQTFGEIHETLREVQELYDNHDSILLVPVSTDQMRAMKIIGENIDFDIVLKNKNTLFF
jgi:CRISPR-associated endonuclease Cas2